MEAAVEVGTDPKLRALYQAGIISECSAWFSEQGGLSRQEQRQMESQAADAVLPELESLVEETGVQPYCTAPMTSESLWNDYVKELETFSGDAVWNFQNRTARL